MAWFWKNKQKRCVRILIERSFKSIPLSYNYGTSLARIFAIWKSGCSRVPNMFSQSATFHYCGTHHEKLVNGDRNKILSNIILNVVAVRSRSLSSVLCTWLWNVCENCVKISVPFFPVSNSHWAKSKCERTNVRASRRARALFWCLHHISLCTFCINCLTIATKCAK